MLCLPSESSCLLPDQFHSLMTTPQSPLRPYYPTTFEVDPYGAAFESEYLVLIPFMDEKLLLKHYQALDLTSLTENQRLRNTHRTSILIIPDETQEAREVECPMVKNVFPVFSIKTHQIPFDIYNISFQAFQLMHRFTKTNPPGPQRVISILREDI